MEIPQVLFRVTTLVDLQLANNQISGLLNPAIGALSKLESLDLTNNQLTELPQELSNLKSIRKLKLSKNKLTQLPASILAEMPKMNELEIADNQLVCLFSGLGELAEGLVLPVLARLDARNSGMERITDIDDVDDSSKPKIEMKSLKDLLLSQNALSSLENLLFALPQLFFLDLRGNRFTTIPNGVLELSTLRNLDMTSNLMEYVPAELGNMHDLTSFVWDGNPVKNVPRTTNTTEALMKLLRRRLETGEPPSKCSGSNASYRERV